MAKIIYMFFSQLLDFKQKYINYAHDKCKAYI